MKIQVKETLARRQTVFFLTLAAIVGVCAFTFSGTQNYAWAEGEGPIATWNSVPAPGDVGVPATGGKNLTLKIKRASSSNQLEAFIMNNGNDPIPPSVLKLTTEEGSVLPPILIHLFLLSAKTQHLPLRARMPIPDSSVQRFTKPSP